MKLLGTTIRHKKFGMGTIIELKEAISPADMKVVIQFENSDLKTFKLSVLDKFFELDVNMLAFVNSLKEENSDYKQKLKEAVEYIEAKKAKQIKELDYEKGIYMEEWQKAARAAIDYRFVFENRAVVIDRKIIYINSLHALNALDMPLEWGELAYYACEKNKGKGSEFSGHHFRFATTDELDSVVEREQK